MAKVNPKTKRAVWDRDKLRCRYCGKSLLYPHETDNPDVRATVDHVVPKAKGGSNRIGNLVTACQRCNHQKGSGIWPGVNLERFRGECDRAQEALRARQLAREIVREEIVLRRGNSANRALKPLRGPVDVFD